jgi:CDP-diacylglycerol--serine O-phosphatidyltransferase
MSNETKKTNGSDKNPFEQTIEAAEGIFPLDEHEEEVLEDGKTVRHRGVFLLPNALTTAAVFCGYYAVISGMNAQFETAAISIFFAMIFDGLDGRVARLTNTTSEFGVQYDSLSDMCSFGIAPALVSYSWATHSLGKVGLAATFIYVACAAIRLARFNTMVGVEDKNYFTGLPSPAAAARVAGMVWFGYDVETSFGIQVAAAIVTAFAGLAMITNLKYNSFKGLDLKGRVPIRKIVLLVVIFVVVAMNPPLALLVIFAGYALSGPITRLLKRN